MLKHRISKYLPRTYKDLGQKALILAAMVVAIVSPVAAPPALPTELDANLLNLDGSNIDVNLLLTVCYTDGDLIPPCEYSTSFPPGWTWSIYLGKSNFYGLVPGLNGTNVTLTVDGYEPVNVIAVENTNVVVTFYLVDTLPPYVIDQDIPSYVFVNTTWNINITWADDHTNVSTAWLVHSDNISKKYFSDSNVTNGSEIKFSWNSYNETSSGEINVTAYANDTIGNINSTSFIYTVIDTIGIVLNSPTPGEYYNTQNITINGKAITSTTANVSYNINNGGIVPIADNITDFSIWTNDTIPNELNSLVIYAVNCYDKNDNATKNVSFYVDTIYPNISFNPNTTQPGGHSQNGIFVNVSVRDNMNLDTITLELIGPSGAINFTSWDGNDSVNYWKNATSLNDGQYTVKVYVNDSAANINVTTNDRTLILDTTPPYINIISPPGTIADESATRIYHVSDLTTDVNWSGASLDGGANVTGNHTFYGLPDGWHTITVYANDTAGNMNKSTVTFEMDNGVQGFYNGSIDNNTFTCNRIYGGKCAIAILNITGNVTGSLDITRFNQTPGGINPLNRTTPSGVYIRINAGLQGSLSSALLRIYYNDLDLDKDGNGKAETPQIDIDPSKLWIYRYNESSENWTKLTSDRQVNQTQSGGYDGYVQANVTGFSYFSFAGGLLPTPPPGPRGSSPYRPYTPTSIPTVVLTSSTDWHYAMLAAGFAAANDYVLFVTPPNTLDIGVKNNIPWFRRLIILGDESVISKDIEENFTLLKKSLEPGYALDIQRVNGTNFYDTSVIFVDMWRDLNGNSTARGIILTRGDVFTDTLIASQLSAATSSPIIYTDPIYLPPWARDKIKELGLDVTIVGGKEAISPEVEETVKALGVNVTRIGGKDRYETAAIVADEYIKAMKKKGRDIDTITFLCGERGGWANTLGFRSYVYNSTILYVRPINDSFAFPVPNRNFINTHPGIVYASIMTENKIKPQGYFFDDSYIRGTNLEVDRGIWKFYMDFDPNKKNYALDTNTVKLSITTSQKVISQLRKAGILTLYKSDSSDKSVEGTEGTKGGGGGECC